MDWSSSKGISWDWSELDQQQSFTSNTHNVNNESDVDLKLGSVTQLGSSSSSSAVPSKRAKAVAAANSTHQAAAASAATSAYYCLVDDCTSDLSNCRDYHRRHKVCEVHSKTPEVTIQGRKQRFCQQCSRFHALDEFDEGKRSCRKRLDGHNRRRRKPQPDTHLHQGTYLSNFPGAGILSFSNHSCNTETMTSMISPNNNWSGSSVNNTQPPHLNLLDKQMPFTDYSSSRYGEAKQLTFSQGRAHVSPQSSEHKVFYDGLAAAVNNQVGLESDCALSLLSRPMLPMHTSTTQQSETSFRNANPTQQSNHFSMVQSNVPDTDVNFHNVFQTEPDVPQTLPFYWE